MDFEYTTIRSIANNLLIVAYNIDSILLIKLPVLGVVHINRLFNSLLLSNIYIYTSDSSAMIILHSSSPYTLLNQ